MHPRSTGGPTASSSPRCTASSMPPAESVIPSPTSSSHPLTRSSSACPNAAAPTGRRRAGGTWVRAPGSPRADSYAEGPRHMPAPACGARGPCGDACLSVAAWTVRILMWGAGGCALCLVTDAPHPSLPCVPGRPSSPLPPRGSTCSTNTQPRTRDMQARGNCCRGRSSKGAM